MPGGFPKVNPPNKKLANPTSVDWTSLCIKYLKKIEKKTNEGHIKGQIRNSITL